MDKKSVHKIKPAGRHILTIGRDLIQNKYAAIVELVKNSYDADAGQVDITIVRNTDNTNILIEDNGSGMSKETIISKWLVPSTDTKVSNRITTSGRVMQGRKGIGRYSAAILGTDLKLETICDGVKSEIQLNWDVFHKAEYLEDIDIEIFTSLSKERNGTKLVINTLGLEEFDWTDLDARTLEDELKKLIPLSEIDKGVKKFDIYLEYKNFQEKLFGNPKIRIEPYPFLDLYDYRIHGVVEENGISHLEFHNQKAPNTVKEKVKLQAIQKTKCGRIKIDLRVYDRDAASIDDLIRRGLKDSAGSYLGKNQAKNLLNSYNGVGVYRNSFRIRPMGDADYDWLRLNKIRVQNPSMHIGTDQVIGFIHIESEEKSNLLETSARDGLKSNTSYESFKSIVNEVINQLETRRFAYRRSSSVNPNKFQQQIVSAFNFEEVKHNIEGILAKSKISTEQHDAIIKVLQQKESEQQKVSSDLTKRIAAYQGQATVGKIVNVIIHEVRRPLEFFKTQIPHLKTGWEMYKEKGEQSIFDQFVLPVVDEIAPHAEQINQLFEKLDPLAKGTRGKKSKSDVGKIIRSAKQVFTQLLEENNIEVEIECKDGCFIVCWDQDIRAIFTNLLDNSIYWILKSQNELKKILIIVKELDGGEYLIDYRDTGTGIAHHLLENNVIFEPDFSTKDGGTGIGLSIAGEAAHRNDFELKAYESDEGAYFRMEPMVLEDKKS
jgi:signal transduction histidine kinase